MCLVYIRSYGLIKSLNSKDEVHIMVSVWSPPLLHSVLLLPALQGIIKKHDTHCMSFVDRSSLAYTRH